MSRRSELIQLEDVLITEKLSRRAPRQPNLQAENQALRSLARQLAQTPEQMLQSLVDLAVDLCSADAAGVSLIETTANDQKAFRWVALAGSLNAYVGGCIPQHSSPCQVCLKRAAPVLFSYPERYFTYYQQANFPIVIEELILPLIADGQVLGTIWIVTHDEQHQFNPEDVRLLTGLADFTTSALRRSQQQASELQAVSTALAVESAERRRQAEGWALALVQDLPGGAVFLIDRDLRYLLAEGEALHVAGFEPEDLVGHTIFEALPPDLAAYYEPKFRRALAGEPFEMEHRAHDHWYISRGTPLYDRHGEAYAVLAISYDITNRKRTEAAIRAADVRLRALTDAAPVLIWETDETSTTFVNRHYLDFFGVSFEALQEMGWARFLHPDDAADYEAAWREAWQQRRAYTYDCRCRRADGQYRWLRTTGQPLGKDRMVSCSVDITESKRAEAEREQLLKREQAAREEAEGANRVKDEFLAILSHELRSPLNPILGWSQLLQAKAFDPVTTQRALVTIERNAKLQSQLIDDLLDINRILRGKLELKETRVTLAEIVKAAIEVVSTAAEAKGIALQLKLTDACQVRGDEARLQQIVWNLLSNAVKFTPEGGQVGVRLEAVCNRACITVTDTGRGISSDFLPYIFQSFRQEDVSVTRHYGGLGLGLAIVKYLVDAHGGTITADSLGEGQGATFVVQIPLLQQQSVPLPALASKRTDLTGVKVLAVDDSQDTRKLLAALLDAYGAEASVVASGAEALAHLTTVAPDVLICDIGMPDMDGYTLLQQIRALPNDQGGNIAAIAVTAFASEEDRQRAVECGFQQHITKPIEPEALTSAIAQLLIR